MEKIQFNYNDGGRAKYFTAKDVRDCVVRAVAIASERDYKEVYDLIKKATKETPRNGVNTHKIGFKRLMSELGFRWVACMGIGTGCKVHLSAEELPKGNIICSVSGHYTAVINGVVNDTYDCTRSGNRCVYGYWTREPKQTPAAKPQAAPAQEKPTALDKLPKAYTEEYTHKGKTYKHRYVLEILGSEKRGYQGYFTWFGPCIPSCSVCTSGMLPMDKMKKKLLENLNKEIQADHSKYQENTKFTFEF